MNIFKYESSPISWCETNYYMTDYICEYYNTLTGFSYILASILLFYNILKIKYENKLIKKYHKSIAIIGILIGIFTIYFHFTLSYVGQLLDEYSIFLLFSLFNFKDTNNILLKALICFVLFISFSNYNRFLLLAYGIFKSKYIFISYFKNNNFKQKKLFRLGLINLQIGILFWLLDIFFCDYLFISTHWLWHLFSGYAFYLIASYIMIYQTNIKFKFKYGLVTI